MAEAYKVKADVSLPKAIRKADELADGTQVYETEGRTYAAGEYVLASDLTPRDKDRAENGDLDHVLEPADVDEAKQAIADAASAKGLFIPEHEAEREVLVRYGHEVVPRSEVLELKSAGADAARENLEAAKEAGVDERPNLTAPEVPSLTEGKTVVSPNAEKVGADAIEEAGVEQPPGHPVGNVLEAAERTEAPAPRKRPGSEEAVKDSDKVNQGSSQDESEKSPRGRDEQAGGNPNAGENQS